VAFERIQKWDVKGYPQTVKGKEILDDEVNPQNGKKHKAKSGRKDFVKFSSSHFPR
jgi:hypothetical protein